MQTESIEILKNIINQSTSLETIKERVNQF